MTVTIPRSLDAALEALASNPSATVLAGGTDAMVEVNYEHRRPTAVVSLRRVEELSQWSVADDVVRLGATVPYSRIVAELAGVAPALAQASRTVGSPQIRNTGTVGGNLATGSPAGDTIPVLAALDATVEVASARGRRELSVSDLIVGVKRTVLEPDELIVAVRFPVAAGPQEFLKIGPRNAMVISIATCAVVVDLGAHSIACALGSVAARPLRCTAAEQFAMAHTDWSHGVVMIDDPRTFETFGSLAASESSPITDHRSTEQYRRHGVAVMARRALMRIAA
jgi:CO/xanthine dehydrogenase FAD-binding subunit